MAEKFVELEGFSKYKFGNEGSIFSKTRNRIMTPWLLNSGYYALRLIDDSGKLRRVLLHRLINKAFNAGYYKEGYVTNHIDGNRTNNRSDNLEWVSQRDNILDMRRRVGDTTPIARKALAKSSLKPVVQFDLQGNRLNTYPSIQAAYIALGKPKNSTSITAVLSGKHKTAFGYLWEFLYEEDKNRDRIKDKEKHAQTIRKNRKKLKPVKRYDENHVFIDSFFNSFDAQEKLGWITHTQITQSISNGKKIKGFYWSY